MIGKVVSGNSRIVRGNKRVLLAQHAGVEGRRNNGNNLSNFTNID